jgi:hypothetical protein
MMCEEGQETAQSTAKFSTIVHMPFLIIAVGILSAIDALSLIIVLQMAEIYQCVILQNDRILIQYRRLKKVLQCNKFRQVT